MSESTLTTDDPEIVARVDHLDCVHDVEHVDRHSDDTSVMETILICISDVFASDIFISPILMNKINDADFDLNTVSECDDDLPYDYALHCHRYED